MDTLTLEVVRRITAALDIRVDLVARWRAGDLDRLLNSRHSALHEQVARMFRDDLPPWAIEPEVSFAVYGERGVIDIFAWHPGRRALLVIELKTDIVDVNDLVGTVDRKRRLARTIAARAWLGSGFGVRLGDRRRRSNEPREDRGPWGDAPGRISDGWPRHHGVVAATPPTRCRHCRCGRTCVAGPQRQT